MAAQKRKMMMDGEKKNIKGNSISLLIFPDTEISAMVAAIASEIVPTTAGWRLRCRGKGRRARDTTSPELSSPLVA